MDETDRLIKLSKETGVYKDLAEPVILTSGELGIYYVNTEKFVQDNGKFAEYGDDPTAMIKHANFMSNQHHIFREVIDILSQRVKTVFSKMPKQYIPMISGGQRRDWLFSGPVAYKLGIPHLALYKEPNKSEEFVFNTNINGKFKGIYDIHIVDLLTEASSCCKDPNGWILQLKNRRITIDNLFSVTTRRQGGEENLKKIRVNSDSLLVIDRDYLQKASNNPERALEYQKNPTEWSKNYLKTNGGLAFVNSFDPEGGKLDRAKKFLVRYGKTLEDCEKFEELKNAVKETYGTELSEIIN